MRQLVRLQDYLSDFRAAGADVLAIHCEGSPRGTKLLADTRRFGFPLANDDRLNVVDKYSVTSTYLIDSKGVIRARWLDQIHKRVGGAAILEALKQFKHE